MKLPSLGCYSPNNCSLEGVQDIAPQQDRISLCMVFRSDELLKAESGELFVGNRSVKDVGVAFDF